MEYIRLSKDALFDLIVMASSFPQFLERTNKDVHTFKDLVSCARNFTRMRTEVEKKGGWHEALDMTYEKAIKVALKRNFPECIFTNN